MGAAAYVGRVGGLAVALGVGTAVFAGQGVAYAEESDSSASQSSPSATSESSPSGTSDTGSATGGADGEAGGADGSGDADGSAGDSDDAGAGDEEVDPQDLEDDAQLDDGADPEDDTALDEDADGDNAGLDETDGTDLGGDSELDDDADGTPTQADPGEVTEQNTDTGSGPDAGEETGSDTSDETDRDYTSETTEATEEPEEQSVNAEPAAIAEQSSTRSAATLSTTATNDPAQAPKEPGTVALFANASTLAANTTLFTQQAAPPRYTLVTAVVNVVNSMIDWARQTANPDPGSAPQPPFMWALLSFARRELETLFAARNASALAASSAATPTSLALTDLTEQQMAALTEEQMAAAVAVPYSPFPNPQVSESTSFISWVTGPYAYSDPTLANTLSRFQVYGTDIGTMWDNGMVDDPSTPWNEHQVLIAVGDTFGGPNMTGRHIYNTLFRSSDDDLSDGMTIPNGEWFNGNMFGGAPLSGPTQARPIINRPSWLPNSVTLIPTAGVSLPTEVTEETPYGTIQYVSFMSVTNWGAPGRWSTNYSAIAYSTDNGENFTVAPESVRYNSIFSGNRNFQQSAFVKGDDGYVYMYGTPNGRQGAAYLSRVTPENILDVSEYEYYQAASSGWFSSNPARWVKNSPSSASAVIGGNKSGPCGCIRSGNSVSEMSVQYNEYLDQYVAMYGDQYNNIVIRTSDVPEGKWSEPTVLMSQQPGGIYAPMMHPWSPSTVGTGSDLYWNLSLWSDYDVMLMRTDLTKI